MADVATKPEGHAYGRRAQYPNKLLTEVGPGTQMGELMRRYWQPVALSREVTDLPRKVKVLGEDLIAFRDRRGRAGLLYPRCMHRGTSLFYGDGVLTTRIPAAADFPDITPLPHRVAVRAKMRRNCLARI